MCSAPGRQLPKRTKLQLALRAVSGKFLPFLRLGPRSGERKRLDPANRNARPHWTRAYAECRAIAKREAKNFYYAFVALPEPRRNAICAIYAFMRKADDLSDDESISREERGADSSEWQAAWHAASASADNGGPGLHRRARCHAALQHSAEPSRRTDGRHYHGSGSSAGDGPDTYATFADLYRYCYLVASVVGLVCIRIFGYSDPAAEKLAEETGVAFQLTNILRDVAEDARAWPRLSAARRPGGA